jgi:hypothetical protein
MKKIILIVIGVALAGLLAALLINQENASTEEINMKVLGDPMDATIEFYQAWHDAELSTTTDPMTENLLAHPRLSGNVLTYLTAALAEEGTEVNPVLCQTKIPPQIGTRLSFALENQAEVHVLARGLDERSPRMAVVKLIGVDGEWVINEINCTNGESGPEREFSFDREGFLLQSVPPPYDPEYWHIVFEDNGVKGRAAPLFFDSSSICISPDGSESVCDPASFTDATPMRVQGEMIETGVNVNRITF